MQKARLTKLFTVLTSVVALASCGTPASSSGSTPVSTSPSSSTSSAKSPAEMEADTIWSILTPAYNTYRDGGFSADIALYAPVSGFEDVDITYVIATDKDEDDQGNVFNNEQTGVTISGSTLVYGDVTEYDNYYINVRASVTIDAESFSNDFTFLVIVPVTIASIKAKYIEANPNPGSGKFVSASLTGTVVSEDWSTGFKNGYYFIADSEGNGIYIFRGTLADGVTPDQIKVGTHVTVVGQFGDDGHGVQFTTGAKLSLAEGDAPVVTPKVVDEATWNNEIANDYSNGGDLVNVDFIAGENAPADVTTKILPGFIGSTAVNLDFNGYTNAGAAFAKEFNDLDVKAGDIISLTTPVAFSGSTAKLVWANDSIAEIKSRSPYSLTVSSESGTLAPTETVTLTATITGLDDTTVTWASSNEEVATVDGNGKVTAIADGFATITATSTQISYLKGKYELYVVSEDIGLKDLKSIFQSGSPANDSGKKITGVSTSGTLVSADINSAGASGYYYIAEEDGTGLYGYKLSTAAGTNAADLVAGAHVTVTGDISSGYGLEISGGSIALAEGAAPTVQPKALDAALLKTLGGSYINYGDWITTDFTVSADTDFSAIATDAATTVSGKIGTTAISWYIAKPSTNSNNADDLIASLKALGTVSAGEVLTITAPFIFYKATAQIGWALNASVVKKA